MPRKSKKHGNRPRFGPEASASEPKLLVSNLKPHLEAGKVSISLRYFHKSCECFSVWTSSELKKFSQTIEKIRGYEPTQLKAKKSLCEMHKGKPDRERFGKPDDLSPDLPFWEIKVDPSNKLRIHGPFIDDVFFLVWLDREHACYGE